MQGIDLFVQEHFLGAGQGRFVPRSPGRQEYRKCGVKSERLELRIEEVLYECHRRGCAEMDALVEYSAANGHRYFAEYKDVRDHGYILIPSASSAEAPRYVMYRPDKHFNRKTSPPLGSLFFVGPDEDALGLVRRIKGGSGLLPRSFFLVSDSGEYVILDLEVVGDFGGLVAGLSVSRKLQGP